mmetsp:Transcript_6821/g.9411  ORF Transcript_6821/g.9411 Transcript_6821/m.9411 type:complete len:84 (+) Transcript_6821:46-297(+)
MRRIGEQLECVPKWQECVPSWQVGMRRPTTTLFPRLRHKLDYILILKNMLDADTLRYVLGARAPDVRGLEALGKVSVDAITQV